ncbi:MAG: hypothetical protein WD315_03620 [Balneolaceae bacterium]
MNRLFFLLLFLWIPTGLIAQNGTVQPETNSGEAKQRVIDDPPPALRYNSLFEWEEKTRMMILDRYHNHGGLFYDRGLFRFTNLSMTKEHSLNLITYNFTPAEQYDWYYRAENSFRTWFGSYNLGMFLQGAQIRNYVTVSDRLTLPIQITRRFDMQAERALIQLGLDYRINENHTAGFSHTLTHQKPDLDATIFYRYGQPDSGFAEVSASALDWANNAAYNLSQRRGTDAPELRKYESAPFFFHLRAGGPVPFVQRLRGELVAGLQTPLNAISELGQSGGEEFRDREMARYAGGLIEYAVTDFTIGATLRQTWARFHRTDAGEPEGHPTDYGNYQIQTTAGIFASTQYGRFYLDSRAWYHFNKDHEYDIQPRTSPYVDGYTYVPFTFRENRWQYQHRIGYNPDRRGFTISAEWSADHRNFLEGAYDWEGGTVYGFDYRQMYPYQLTTLNTRITLMWGFRFNEFSSFVMGASYDLDGDRTGGFYENDIHPHTHFDGGFARFVLYW